MRKLLPIAFAMMIIACTKTGHPKIPTAATHEFFQNETEMHSKIQTALEKLSPGEKLEDIDNVSYIDSKEKSYALVFYRSNRRAGNLLLENHYQSGMLVASTAISCTGASCTCNVLTTISSAGDVTVNCSCSSCTMLVN